MSHESTPQGWVLPAILAAATGAGATALGFSADRTKTHDIPAGVTVVEAYDGHHRFDWRQEGETRFRELTTTHGPATLEAARWVEIEQVTYGQEQLRFERLAAKTRDGQDVTGDLHINLQAQPSMIGKLDQQHPRWARDIATMVAESWTEAVANYDHHALTGLDRGAMERTLSASLTARLAEEIPGLALTSVSSGTIRLNGKPLTNPSTDTVGTSPINGDDVTRWRTQRAAVETPAPAPSPRLVLGG